jgi:hypothetical protein
MLDVALAARPLLRPAIETSIPGKTPKLYFEQVPGTAVEPYALMRVGADAPLDRIMHQYTSTVYLDLWALGVGQLAQLENAIEFLDYYDAPDYGDCIGAQYRLESTTRLAESETRLHTTKLYAVRYFDRRKLT